MILKEFEVKCKKCGSTRVFVHSDENYKLSFTCLNCKHKEFIKID